MLEILQARDDDPILISLRSRPVVDPDGMDAVLDEVNRQATMPPSGDEAIGAMWQAVPEFLDPKMLLGAWVHAFAIRQPRGIPISEQVGKLRAGFQLERVKTEPDFPLTQNYTSTKTWRRVFDALVRDYDRLWHVGEVLNHLPVNTILDFRYAPFEAMCQAQHSASEGPIDRWEGGGSVLIGAKAIMRKDEFALPQAKILRWITPRCGGEPRLVADEPAQASYRQRLTAPGLPGRFISTDIWPYRDSQIRLLAEAVLRPSERLDQAFLKRFRDLRDRELPGLVVFEEADLCDPLHMKRLKEKYGGQSLKVGFLGTVLNQIGEEFMPGVIEESLHLLADDGTLFILEFGFVPPDKPDEFHLHRTWSDWKYGLFAIHKADPKRQVQELMRFRTSRCTEAVLCSGSLYIDGSFVPIKELLGAS